MTKDDMPDKVWAYRTEFGDVRITGNDLLPEKDRLREYVPADLAQPPAVDVEALKRECIDETCSDITIEHLGHGAVVEAVIDQLHQRGLIGQPVGREDANDFDWSEIRKPNDMCAYHHVVTHTPLGQLSIEWKGWKERPTYVCQMPWQDDTGISEIVCADTLDEAKAEVLATWRNFIRSILKHHAGE